MPSNDATYDTITGADGVAVIEVRASTNLRPWVVTQVSVEMPSAVPSVQCALRKNGNFITPLLATGDAAGGDPPVLLGASDVMTITWTGANRGDVARAVVTYSDQPAH